MESCLGDPHSKEARLTALRRAVSLVVEALDTIDGFDGSPAAAAHLQLALAALREGVPEVKSTS
jgi:hypothetical protein